jgi:hypothetical protein
MAATCLLFALCACFALPVRADSKAETMKPPPEAAKPVDEATLRARLETEYREQLAQRIAQEKTSYEGSLTSLWMSNAAVWAVLMAFIVLQALSARKRGAQLELLRAARQGG